MTKHTTHSTSLTFSNFISVTIRMKWKTCLELNRDEDDTVHYKEILIMFPHFSMTGCI